MEKKNLATKVFALNESYLVVKELPDIESSIAEFELNSIFWEDYNYIIRVNYNPDMYKVDYWLDYEVYIINKETEELEDWDSWEEWFYEHLI